MPKLSIVIPVYNAEEYLKQCIDSVLGQTFSDFELILVDDGSTDGSGAICDACAGKDDRIRVIHRENGGVTRARKAGMRIATGSWISFIDGDDWIHSTMFATMLEKAEASGAQMVVCDIALEFPDRTEIMGTLAEEGCYDKAAMAQTIYPTMMMDLGKCRSGVNGGLCNKLFERALLEPVFWAVEDSMVLSEDAQCTYGALLESQRVYILREPLYYYRQHMASATHQFDGTKRYRDLLQSYTTRSALLQKHGPAFYGQLYDFVAVDSVNNLCKVLLFDTATPLTKRFAQAKEFASREIVATALREAEKKCSNPKDRLKMRLALHRRVWLLYALLAGKQLWRNFRGHTMGE